MKTAEILLSYMDELQKFIELINGYVEQGIAFFLKVKAWIQKIIGYIEQGIDALVDSIGGRKPKVDFLDFKEYDLFV